MDETSTAGSPTTTAPLEAPMFSVVTAVYDVARYLPEFIASLEAQTIGHHDLEVIAVDDGSTDESLAVLQGWAARSDIPVVVLTKENGGQASARNLGLEHATGRWVTFTDPDDTVSPNYFRAMADFAGAHPEAQFLSANVVLVEERLGRVSKHPRWRMYSNGDRLVDLDVSTAYIPGSSTTSAMRRDVIGDLRFNAGLRPNFEDGDFAVRYLMAAPSRATGFIGSIEYFYRKRGDQSSTLQTGLTVVGRYDTVPRDGYLALLREAADRLGRPPMWLQHVVLYELSWYFSSEDAMANSASSIDGELAETFRATLAEIVTLLSPDIIDSYTIRKLQPHWRDTMLHGVNGETWHTPYAVVDRYDPAQRLVRISYRFTGQAPSETVTSRGVDGRPHPRQGAQHRLLRRDPDARADHVDQLQRHRRGDGGRRAPRAARRLAGHEDPGARAQGDRHPADAEVAATGGSPAPGPGGPGPVARGPGAGAEAVPQGVGVDGPDPRCE